MANEPEIIVPESVRELLALVDAICAFDGQAALDAILAGTTTETPFTYARNALAVIAGAGVSLSALNEAYHIASESGVHSMLVGRAAQWYPEVPRHG